MSLSNAKETIEVAIRENSNLLDLCNEQLTDAQLKILIPDILKIKNLTLLYLSGNNLSDVSFLTALKGLTLLDLSNNNLSDVSFLTELKGLTTLDLRNNPNLPFSDEVLDDWRDAPKILNYIREYYAEQNKGNLRKLNEAKLVVIGEANVGKTCVINRLIDKKFVQTDSTHGIQIRKWKEVELENGEKVQMNVWDFGGQEIMHSTHQFFFTRRTVYVLVINARENEDTNKTEEWLQRIQNLSQNSPVIIVGNKIDENNRGTDQTSLGYFDIERKRLTEKFPTLLKGIYGITSNVNKPQYDFLFDKFETAIKKEIQNLANIHDQFPKKWFEVKDKLELMKENKTSYIEYGEYIDYCIKAGMDNNQNRKTWIEFLNDIGIALTYSSDKDLENYLAVLNPEWITSGVYSLIDNTQITLNKGILKREEIGLYLNQTKYPTNTQDFILNIMRKFKLLIDIDKKTFLIPDLLPKDEPDTGVWKDVLYFQYSYDIYEKSIIRRFMVEMFGLCSKNTYWRNGMLLKLKDNRALIRADGFDKTISIKIDGNQNTRRDLLAIIRDKFLIIHESFDNLRFQEKVAHKKYTEILKDYQDLLHMEADGQSEVYVKELGQKVSIFEFLSGIEFSSDYKMIELKQLEQLQKAETERIFKARLETNEKLLIEIKYQAKIAVLKKKLYGFMVFVLLLITWFLFVFYFGWNVMETPTYLLAIPILILLLMFHTKYEKEFQGLLEKFNFDLQDHKESSRKLLETEKQK